MSLNVSDWSIDRQEQTNMIVADWSTDRQEQMNMIVADWSTDRYEQMKAAENIADCGVATDDEPLIVKCNV